jgi:hypothetical protein
MSKSRQDANSSVEDEEFDDWYVVCCLVPISLLMVGLGTKGSSAQAAVVS